MRGEEALQLDLGMVLLKMVDDGRTFRLISQISREVSHAVHMELILDPGLYVWVPLEAVIFYF